MISKDKKTAAGKPFIALTQNEYLRALKPELNQKENSEEIIVQNPLFMQSMTDAELLELEAEAKRCKMYAKLYEIKFTDDKEEHSIDEVVTPLMKKHVKKECNTRGGLRL